MFHRAGLILCLSAILVWVSAEIDCPFPEEIEPCTCGNLKTEEGITDDVYIECGKMYDTQKLLRVFENARRHHFISFILHNSTLQYIPYQIFDDVMINEIQMYNVTLRNLFDQVPRDPGLTHILVKGLKVLGGWGWKNLAVFKSLWMLSLWDVPLKKLTTDSLGNVSKMLVILEFKNCELQHLPDDVFADFTELDNIMLSNNPIAVLKRTMFPRSAKIRFMLLSYNKISTLPSDLFSDMPILERVDLNGNMLAVLPEDTFRPVISQLNFIDVRENPIKCDCLIAWLLQVKPAYGLRGTCYAPKPLHNRELYELTPKDIRC